MGHEDLGNFYFESGDLSNAYKSYLRMRDACTASRHIQDMSLLVIKTAILQNNWTTVQQNVGKLRAVAATKEEEESLLPKITVTQGLLALQNNNFTAAAKAFMECPPKLDWPEIIAPNDVATYGGLCALASLSRKQLKDEVLENANFREYLDLEAHVRKAIKHFINARYRECLELLKEYKNNYLLDIYFTEHVEKLYHAIRKKCMVSYMIPFSDVWISEMAAEFGVSNEKLQEEVEALIMSGDLKARIDTRQKVCSLLLMLPIFFFPSLPPSWTNITCPNS
jgi:COP9 signalosome complex subunit 1